MDVNSKLDQFMLSDEYDIFKEGEYITDEDAKGNYVKAIDAFKKLAREMICNLKIDDPDIPYQYHAIRVKWRPDEDGMIEPETEMVIKGLKEMDLCISELKPLEWQIGKQIYQAK